MMIAKKHSLKFKIKSQALPYLGLASLVVIFFALFMLLMDVLYVGAPRLNWDFFATFPSRFPAKAGILPALIGTLWLMVLTAAISIPLGVLTAIFLEEYAPKNAYTEFLRTNIANLAGVPSVVYGILGLALFVRWMSLGQSLISGALTMSLLIMPIIIITSAEAIRAVPQKLRDAAFGVGATKSQVVWHHVLPQSVPGILTGVILAISRAIGETAPLILVGALVYASYLPEGVTDGFTALSLQIFNWAGRPHAGFHETSAAGILVLLAVTLGLNGVAIYLRTRINRRKA